MALCVTSATSWAQVSEEAPVENAEKQALARWQQLQAETHPQPRDRAEFDQVLQGRLKQLDAFSKEFSGTLASYEARHRIGLMQIHALARPDLGLETMGWIHRALKRRPAPLPNGEVVEGISYDPQRYFLLYARTLAEYNRYDEAAAVLLPYLGRQDPSGELARALDLEVRLWRRTAPGQVFPAFTAMDMQSNQPLQLSSYRGRVTLLIYWSRTDPPCMRLLPRLEALRKQYADRDLAVLGIPLEESPDHLDELRATIKNFNLDWPQLAQTDGWNSPLAKPNAVRSLPALFLLDTQGVVRLRHPRWTELLDALAVLLPNDG